MTAPSQASGHRAAPARWALPLAVAAGAGIWLWDFPTAAAALAVLLAAAAALVAWRPVLVLVLVPAALPVLDLAPWSGRRLLDEFDVLVALLLAVAWARLPPAGRAPPRRAETWAWAALLALLLLGTARALLNGPAIDWADSGNPLSALNALRLLKGAFEAWGLWAAARRFQAAGIDVGPPFGWGLVAGLAATVVVILAERLAFSYLLDFGSDYRISGPFAVMSLGGAYVECFLTLATPFLLARLLPPVAPWRLIAGCVLLAGTAYAVMVTYSRGGYAAMVVAVLAMLLAALSARQQRAQRALVVLALSALTGAVAYPVLTGAFAQARLKTVASDLGIRERHWAESQLALGSSPLNQWLGVGLGRFAEVNFWTSPNGARAGGHHLEHNTERGQALRLGAGYAYFIEQIMPVEPGGRYRLQYRLRLDDPRGGMGAALCQKWIIASFDCAQVQPVAGSTPAPAAGTWQTVRLDLVAPAAGPGRLPRPIRLSLHNQGQTPLSVDEVSLVAADGRELVRNGSFEHGLDHWTFTSDHHLAWHTKSMLLGIQVELGLLGAAAFLALMLVGSWRALGAARQGRPDGMALLAATAAFASVGLVDTLVDAPRFLMLWLLLCLMPAALPGQRAVS